MKTYRELNSEEKIELTSLIDDVLKILPLNNNFFSAEKIDSSGNFVLKTKQDYDKDKNDILRIIEEKRKEGLFDKDKSKRMKLAITTLFNEFIRISPKKVFDISCREVKEVTDTNLKAIYNGRVMSVGELYIKISDTYVKIPEKALYKILDIPNNDEMQSMQYFICDEDKIKYLNENEGVNYERK